MILTKEEILKKIKKGEINIEPFNKDAIGPASIDLTLDNKIRTFDNKKLKIISEDIDYKKFTKKKKINKGYTLNPGELVLGITKEKISLPSNIAGWLQSRSRFARIGLMSHITAPFVAPGVENKQVLEIYNASPHKFKLLPNTRICHIILQKCEGNARYKGQFKKQEL